MRDCNHFIFSLLPVFQLLAFQPLIVNVSLMMLESVISIVIRLSGSSWVNSLYKYLCFTQLEMHLFDGPDWGHSTGDRKSSCRIWTHDLMIKRRELYLKLEPLIIKGAYGRKKVLIIKN